MQELKTISSNSRKIHLATKIQQIRVIFTKIFSIRAATAKTKRRSWRM